MTYEDVMNLAMRRGFFFRAAETYPNTPAGFWDYGPLGVLFKNRFIASWRRNIVKKNEMIEIDTVQILPRPVFVASGHIGNFTDPFIECPKCHAVYRADKLIEDKLKRPVPENLRDEEYDDLLKANNVRCSNCGTLLSGTKRFNMMFRVGIGPLGEEAYLRPETCQGIFVDVPYLLKTQRVKLPKGFAQIGKSFRNEIAPRQGILRLRELNQAEVEVLFDPSKVDSPSFERSMDFDLNISEGDISPTAVKASQAVERGLVPNKLIAYYLTVIQGFYQDLGVPNSKIRLRKLSDTEKAFYSSVAFDLEVSSQIGWLELVACNYRTDYDLKRHAEVSGSDFSYDDMGHKVIPHVFELSMGIDRSLYYLLENSYRVEEGRTFLSLKPSIAPVQLGVFPLVAKDGLPEEARRIYEDLSADFDVLYDESGSIGRRYARADEAGVPFCATVDRDTLTAGTVTVRVRDTRAQETIKVTDLSSWLAARLRA